MGSCYRHLFKLYDLIQSGDVRSVENFLEENTVDVNDILWCKNISVLHLAVGIEPLDKSIQCTEILLKHGADPNLQNQDGITPVHIASIWGRVTNLKLLIGCGGDPSRKDIEGQSAFDYAAREQQWDVYDHLHNVVDELDDSFGPAYSLELEKVLMTTDQMVAEYEPVIEDAPQPSTTSVRKSEMVREWCEKSSLVMNKLYPTIMNDTFTIYTDSAHWRTINLNLTKNITLDLTYDVNTTHFDETTNTYKTCLSKPSSKNIEISGIQRINITSDKSSIEPSIEPTETNKQRLSVYENFSLPGSPSSVTHINYHSRSSLKTQKKIRGSKESIDPQIISLDNSSSLFTEDCSQDLNRALEVTQNETNEILSNNSNDFKENLSSRCSCKTDNKCTCPNKKSNHELLMEELNQKLRNRTRSISDSEKLNRNPTLDTNKNLKSQDSFASNQSRQNTANSIKNMLVNRMSDFPSNTRRSSASSGVSSTYSGGGIVIANVEEEYKYKDKEEDVVLIEKRLLVSPVVLPVDEPADSTPDQTIISVASSLPNAMAYDNNTLRAELVRLGFTPGPISHTTRTLYLKKLNTLKRNPIVKTSHGKTYSIELEKSLRSGDWIQNLSPYIELENKARDDFANPNKKWREGTTKTSFTYLLLDPRLTANLPGRSAKQTPHVSWVTFVNSIFYVGKGKRSRPYSHLYQALELWKRDFRTTQDKKVKHILDIWSDKVGVVCLHIFQNVIPAEAYTYEAAMIDVLGAQNLTNVKSGNYYGAVACWPLKERRMLGLYLLYKAMLIFLSEGERQLRPEDID